MRKPYLRLTVSGYVMACAFAVMFLTYIDGDMGWLLLYFLIGAAVISLAAALISRRHFCVSVKDFSGVAEPNSKIDIAITISKKGFCFLPHISIEGALGEQRFVASAPLLLKKTVQINVSVKPQSCGINIITLEPPRIRDFLGLIDVGAGRNQICTKAAVLPRTVDYTGPEVVPDMLPADDDDAEFTKTVSTGGLPGCEHREYISGDSPRRIDFKLSAKRQRLLVRLEEGSGSMHTDILIEDSAEGKDAEQAFALARQLVQRGGTVKVRHCGDSFTADSRETIGRLGEWLAFREYGMTAANAKPQSPTSGVIFSAQGVRQVTKNQF